jgi:hypothetical protein
MTRTLLAGQKNGQTVFVRPRTNPGLPDGIRIYKLKSQLGSLMESLAVEDVGTFYGLLVYFTASWYILWSFGIFCGHLVYFGVIWYVI